MYNSHRPKLRREDEHFLRTYKVVNKETAESETCEQINEKQEKKEEENSTLKLKDKARLLYSMEKFSDYTNRIYESPRMNSSQFQERKEELKTHLTEIILAAAECYDYEPEETTRQIESMVNDVEKIAKEPIDPEELEQLRDDLNRVREEKGKLLKNQK
ncbi:uncharacterized protein LOC121866254 [Homarus americanus]|uniref:uncharacterized protein LOC121866254 n=1 Tax=Homarus americanus TaxID=6706 RepID=UPI001C48146A|nr:uncharacterized protein LOC121866254 [Homarus americanus]XP_042221801.1 uncharacterized protein LOC121866254 [Homarus americanus]XP_042221802.1 uncharacterized protein LOC121866254 [Homarus americanus]XP_042221803.1 uncharacterized protein LOC121866254 [Homarus americanus]XP_042221804.1 uncharacterized protein LOC121866254 [Homarus americanus]XP_042221805.1 uncharacterized protein LOC121866254 [Homarus americanus]